MLNFLSRPLSFFFPASGRADRTQASNAPKADLDIGTDDDDERGYFSAKEEEEESIFCKDDERSEEEATVSEAPIVERRISTRRKPTPTAQAKNVSVDEHNSDVRHEQEIVNMDDEYVEEKWQSFLREKQRSFNDQRRVKPISSQRAVIEESTEDSDDDSEEDENSYEDKDSNVISEGEGCSHASSPPNKKLKTDTTGADTPLLISVVGTRKASDNLYALLPSPLRNETELRKLRRAYFPIKLLNRDGRIGVYGPRERRQRLAQFAKKRKFRQIHKTDQTVTVRMRLGAVRPRGKLGRWMQPSELSTENSGE